MNKTFFIKLYDTTILYSKHLLFQKHELRRQAESLETSWVCLGPLEEEDLWKHLRFWWHPWAYHS